MLRLDTSEKQSVSPMLRRHKGSTKGIANLLCRKTWGFCIDCMPSSRIGKHRPMPRKKQQGKMSMRNNSSSNRCTEQSRAPQSGASQVRRSAPQLEHLFWQTVLDLMSMKVSHRRALFLSLCLVHFVDIWLSIVVDIWLSIVVNVVWRHYAKKGIEVVMRMLELSTRMIIFTTN